MTITPVLAAGVAAFAASPCPWCREPRVDCVCDVRRVPPPWVELEDLVEGARQRGYTDEQVEYLCAVLGITWAKAFRAGERKAGGT